MNKRGLGKGLEALLPQLNVSESDAVAHLDVRDLRPNPYQPRQDFNEEKLQELADSIREHGIIQPLVVRKSSIRGYDIVAGERRFRAAQMVGLTTVPAVVREFSDVELMEIAVIENLQREDLNAIEIAEAYAQLMNKAQLTQEQLAKRVGQSRSHVANMLRLLQLPRQVRTLVSRGTLSMGHARALLAVEDEKKQAELAEKVVKEDMSVRKLESLIYSPKKNVSRETVPQKNVTHIKHYEERLRTFLGTQVRIHQGKKRGKIEIEYFSPDDLERILNLFSNLH
ncbi:ParB/RepB/Spo0J family partition protein [Alicyclobacillus pomorum]|uniref:ParB/RepB/Spo0J family partition protein n=1 Tax=Alicyclobacillus pomorum TaxID=204470 RepID=UPI0003F699A4|nr:ParB/RepB/Spo0J family partition protein [Alicyclobacillus pomorum]